MNTNQHSYLDFNMYSIETMSRFLAAQLAMLSINCLGLQTKSYIKIKDKITNEEIKDIERFAYPTFQDLITTWGSTPLEQKVKEYCLCEPTINNEKLIKSLNQEGEGADFQKFETYKQLKEAAKVINPEITKEEIYEQLLKPFRYEKVKEWDETQNRFKTYYICRYDEWNRVLSKTWNLLDHVRMHEGIKPFVCQLWGKTFTQKGNLRKHHIVQHSTESLEERKKFRCDLWGKGYTERYNLLVIFNFIIRY